MATDLTIRLVNRPGTLAEASDTLGRAGANIEGACGYVCETGQGVFHVLVSDPERGRRALIDAGFEIQAERPVVVVPVANTPGAGAKLFRQVANAGLNIDLMYQSADGGLVLGGDDVHAIGDALA
jgi:hypothetical protein